MDVNATLPPPLTARDLFRILRRRAWLALATFVLVCGLTLYFTSKMPKVYQTTARVYINGATTTAAPANIMEWFTGGNNNSLDVEVEKMQATSFLSRVLERIGSKTLNTDALKGMIRVTPGPNAQILDISVKADTPRLASKIANTAADEYIALVKQEYEDRVDASEDRLKKAGAEAQKEKDAAQEQLTSFTSKASLSDPSLVYRDQANRTVAARTNLDDAKRNLPLMEAQLVQLRAQLKEVPAEIYSSILVKNSAIDTYKNEILALQLQRRSLLNDFAPDSPEVQDINDKIKAREEAVAQATQNPFSKSQRSVSRNPDYSAIQSAIPPLERSIADAKRNIAVQEKRVAQLNEQQKSLTLQQNQYEALKRKRDNAQELYDLASSGLMKMNLTRTTNAPSLKMLETARVPENPISPKPTLNLIMAVALGLMLAVGAALLTEYSASGSMLDEEALGHALPRVGGVPLLGVLPLSLPAPATVQGQNAEDLPAPLSHRVGGMLASDVLREIGFTLTHRHAKDPVPVILLSGTRSDEATAAIAAQLAATLVRDGVRVTLVDADRALPRLNRVFGAPDAPGLADVLAGRKLARDIMHVGAGGGLRFLAAGSPQDTTAMTEENLRSLFKQLADARDTDAVIVSGPSVWQVPLIAPLEKAAGGVVLIAPAGDGIMGTTPADSVARARRLLSNGYKAQVRGVIVGLDDTLPTTASIIPADATNPPALPTGDV